MKNFKIKNNQLLFLYAYLRLIDLSLDRSRWTSWSELQSYFENSITPSQVIQYMENSFHFSKPDFNEFVFFIEKKTIFGKIKSALFKKLLEQNEIFCCYHLLRNFEKILKSDIENYDLEIEKLRIEIAKYYTEVLELKIATKDLNMLMRVEHFEQNDSIEIIKINKFVPNDFISMAGVSTNASALRDVPVRVISK